MAQWGQGQQPGYQYPMQTGFPGGNPQFQQGGQFQQQPQFQQQQGFGQGGIAPQPTGFPGQRPGGFQQGQPTGFQPQQGGFQQPQQTGFIQSQPTGFVTTNFQNRAPPPVPPVPSQFQNQVRPPPPPVPALPQQFQNQGGSFLGAQQQPTRFLSPSPGMGGPGLSAQPTGFAGAQGFNGGRLLPQPTGFVDPRLQMMQSSFMPANMSQPYGASGAPQLAPISMDLQQSFQQHNQQRGPVAPKIPWALSKGEKKNYDAIFRAWEAQGTGYISGTTALDVFGQSGLPKQDLADIWHLSDIDNKGKLNMAEFHVAMGLIYRRLNGNEIPAQLPAELVPPSSRDLDSSVDFLKRVLENETRSRSPSSVDTPISRMKERSFTGNSAGRDGKDATVYKHSDAEPPGGFYKPASRHVDRNAVRSRNEEDSPSADLSDMKRQLEKTAQMLDRASETTAEDQALDREMDDLKYRVKRVQEDLEYVSKGPRTNSKDEERRKLEREMLKLMHERIPEVERKIEERDRRKEREKRQWQNDRDRRNERHGRYDDKDEYSSRDQDYSSSRYRDDDGDRSYSRNNSRNDYDRGGRDRYRDRSRDRDTRDRSHSRERDRYERPRSPPAARSPPPPPPPPAAPQSSLSLPPQAPAPSKSPAPNTKNMTPAERQAYLRAEAKRRIDARTQALGLNAPPTTSTLDLGVEERLAQDKKEAEEKAREAERQAELRAKARQERLDSEKALKEGDSTPATPVAPAVAPTPPVVRVAPPTPKPRAPAPPPPVKRGSAPKTPIARTPIAPPAPVVAPQPPAPLAEPDVDPEEAAILARQETLRKAKEAREARLRQLQEEEERERLESERERLESEKARRVEQAREARLRQLREDEERDRLEAEEARRAEEAYQARRNAVKAAPPVAPASPPTAYPPPAPVVAPASPSMDKSKTNPFSQFRQQNGATATPASPPAPPAPPPTESSNNPYVRSHTAPPPVAPTPPKTPTPTAVKTSYQTAPDDDDDWEAIEEKYDDDSDDEISASRDVRMNIAQSLFKGSLPPARPQSAGPPTTQAKPASSSPATSSFAPPPAPPAPAVPFAPPPPAPPVAPPAPRAPTTDTDSASAAPPGGMNALLASIQSGRSLKKVQTVDKSAPPVSGKVLGDAAPPEHINAAPRPPSPPSPVSQLQSIPLENAGIAAFNPPTTVHEDEEDEEAFYDAPASVPSIQVQDEAPAQVDPMSDVDLSVEFRVRTLYPYQGEKAEDLTFGENLIINANPSKSGGDWWFGTLTRDGKSGFFPKAYVHEVQHVVAKALFSYTGSNSDELPFVEGDELSIVDTSDADWWKADQGGVVFIIPAGYVEIIEADSQLGANEAQSQQSAAFVQSQIVSIPQIYGNEQEELSEPTSEEEQDSYESSSDSESEDDTNESKEEREAREEHERQLVLQAAGLIVTKEKLPPPPRPARRKSIRPGKRRPAPAAPLQHRNSYSSAKDLPPIPGESPTSKASSHLDDAFDRYETFKQTQGGINNRASVELQSPPTVTPISPSNSLAPSMNQESSHSRTHSLLHFLGRKTPVPEPSTMDKRTISAPMMQISNSAPSRENSPAFGTSWASLVDKSVLQDIPSDDRRRQETIFELINTEAAYVRDLQLIVEEFYSSMLSLLDEKAIVVVFANVEELLIVNTTFLSSLEERQKECRLYIDNIGDILNTHMSNMAVYTEYCVNQANAIKVLQSLRDSNPKLASHLQTIRDSNPTVRNLDLSSYLLSPMQRITKYPLLIRQILTHGSATPQERRNLETALEMAERILGHINETIREQQGTERLKAVSQNLWIGQGRLDLTAPTRYMGPRKLIKEGQLTKTKSGRKLRGFLCSDIMVLTDEAASTLYRMPIPLTEMEIKEAPGGRDDLAFQIAVAYPRGGNSVVLRAGSARDCQLWMQTINEACRKSREAQSQAQSRPIHKRTSSLY